MQDSVLRRSINSPRSIRHTLERTRNCIKVFVIEHKDLLFVRAVSYEMRNMILYKVLPAHRIARHSLAFRQQRVHIEQPVLGSPNSKSLVAGQQICVRHFCRLIIAKHMRGAKHLEKITQIPLLLHHLKKGLVGHWSAFITIMFVPRIGTRHCRHRKHLYFIICFHIPVFYIYPISPHINGCPRLPPRHRCSSAQSRNN